MVFLMLPERDVGLVDFLSPPDLDLDELLCIVRDFDEELVGLRFSTDLDADQPVLRIEPELGFSRILLDLDEDPIVLRTVPDLDLVSKGFADIRDLDVELVLPIFPDLDVDPIVFRMLPERDIELLVPDLDVDH